MTRDPAQIRSHFDGPPQDRRRADDDRRMPPYCRHRAPCSAAATWRPTSTATVPRATECGSSSASDSRQRHSKDSESGKRVGRRALGPPPAAADRPSERRRSRRRCSTCLQRGVRRACFQGSSLLVHSRNSCHHQESLIFSNVCSIRRDCKHPPTDTVKSGAEPARTFPLIDGDIEKCHPSMLVTTVVTQ